MNGLRDKRGEQRAARLPITKQYLQQKIKLFNLLLSRRTKKTSLPRSPSQHHQGAQPAREKNSAFFRIPIESLSLSALRPQTRPPARLLDGRETRMRKKTHKKEVI